MVFASSFYAASCELLQAEGRKTRFVTCLFVSKRFLKGGRSERDGWITWEGSGRCQDDDGEPGVGVKL